MNLAEVVKRAKIALNTKPERKLQTVYIGSIDADVVFHSVTMQEKSELLTMAKNDDRLWMRKMILAASEDLRRLAMELVKAGTLVEPEGVVGVMSEADQLQVFRLVESLSQEESTIIIGGKAAQDVKNS